MQETTDRIKEIRNKLHRKFGLHKRHKSGGDNVPWVSLRKLNRNHLAELFGELGFNTGAEIGVRRGRFSEILCKNNPELLLYCIDPWNNYHPSYTQERQDKIYRVAVDRLSQYKVKILRKPSMEALELINDSSLDFVYIDGNHHFDYCCPDIIHWAYKVKEGGIIAVHDYYSFKNAGVRQAVDAYTHAHNIYPWYCTKELEPTAFWVNNLRGRGVPE